MTRRGPLQVLNTPAARSASGQLTTQHVAALPALIRALKDGNADEAQLAAAVAAAPTLYMTAADTAALIALGVDLGWFAYTPTTDPHRIVRLTVLGQSAIRNGGHR